MSSPQTVQSLQTSRVPLSSIDNRPMVAPQKDALNAVPDLQKVYEKDGDEERKEDPDSKNDEAGTDGDENSDKGSEADSEESDVPRRKPFKRGRDQTRIRDNQEDLSGSEDSVEKPFSKSSPGSKCQVESDSESSQDISPGRKRKFSKPVVSNDGEVEDDDFQMTAKPKDPAPGSYCSKPLLRNRDAGSDEDDKQDDESDGEGSAGTLSPSNSGGMDDDYEPPMSSSSENVSSSEDDSDCQMTSGDEQDKEESEQEDTMGDNEKFDPSTVKRLYKTSKHKDASAKKYPARKPHKKNQSEYWENLEKHFRKLGCLGPCQPLKEILDQWCLTWVEDLESLDGNCPCGKEGIRFLCHIKNVKNGTETYVGSKCIERFNLGDRTVAGILQNLLLRGITVTLVDKKSMKFAIKRENIGLVQNRERFKISGSLPLQMPREAKRNYPILTVTGGGKNRSIVNQMKKGLVYKLWLQLTLEKDESASGVWKINITQSVRVKAHSPLPKDVQKYLRM
ncbi:uncharacterized protein LOC110989864 isoform X2 [Acanthaster planci]|uniref:Uncharacterized protein LOC110989864 isoform X2 n=1 Tax=Acanthaster planci TaxID=133434 RepID=A0A8B7ZXG4_ACAPL|nr:uncharacterized protein LOC110989864 isoform X2 [Acanthaster planci]